MQALPERALPRPGGPWAFPRAPWSTAGDTVDDLAPWHALQEWLQGAEHRITIPYAEALADAIPPVAIRLRRDYGMVLALIRTHAVLHQATRERDEGGRIIATLEDYAAVRDLVADLVAEGVEGTVSSTVRETVITVKDLTIPHPEGISVSMVARELKLDRGSASRRVQAAIEGGYLKNLEGQKGRPARLVVGDPLPEEVKILPAPETLAGYCAVAGVAEGIKTPPPPSEAS